MSVCRSPPSPGPRPPRRRYPRCGRRAPGHPEEQVRSLLRESGISDAWVADLADQRKLFFHNTAPWIALRIISRSPLKAELLVLKCNVRDLEGSPDVIGFDRLKAVYSGLIGAMERLQGWLITQVHDKDAAPDGS